MRYSSHLNCMLVLSVIAIILPSCGQEIEPRNPRPITNDPSSSDLEEGENLPLYSNMLILGDSISVGVLSETRLGDPLKVAVDSQDVSLIVSEETRLDIPILELVNSDLTINTGLIVSRLLELQDSYKNRPSAFFGGIDLDQDQGSLASLLGLKSTEVRHGGFSGYKSGDVAQRSLPQAMEEDGDFDLVVLEIGANDFCSSQSSSQLLVDFRDNLRNILEQIGEMASNPQLVVLPIPDIPTILDKVKGEVVASIDLDFIGRHTLTCFDMQRNYCPRITQDYQSVVTLRDEMNRIIAEELEEFDLQTDGSPAVLVHQVANAENFPDDALSLDCFHPGEVGHSILSQAVYEALSNAN